MASNYNWVGSTSTDMGVTTNWSSAVLPPYNNTGTIGSVTNYPALGACNGISLTLSAGTNAKINGGVFSCAIIINATAVGIGLEHIRFRCLELAIGIITSFWALV